MEYKDGKVVILPTNNEANMGDFIIYQYNQDCYIDGKNLKDNLVCGIKKCDGNIDTTNQHLYITSDEKPKDGDWCYHPELSQEYTIINNGIQTKGLHPTKGVFQWRDTTNKWYKKARKIIATTDTSVNNGEILTNHIIKEGPNAGLIVQLPQPSTQFIEQWIEEYNKGNVITDVKVGYEEFMTDVIIGKTKIELKVNPDNTIDIKLPQPTLYTEEEVIEILHKYVNKQIKEALSDTPIENIQTIDKWIEENLKK